MASARIVEPLRRTCWLKNYCLFAPLVVLLRPTYERIQLASITPMPDTTPSRAPTESASPLKRAAFPAAILMLVGWAVWTFAFAPAPGWVHLFLTVGVFLLIWAIVARDDLTVPRASSSARHD